MRQQMGDFLLPTSLPVRVPAARNRCNHRRNLLRKSEDFKFQQIFREEQSDYDNHNDNNDNKWRNDDDYGYDNYDNNSSNNGTG
jgi:hypothetical protein